MFWGLWGVRSWGTEDECYVRIDVMLLDAFESDLCSSCYWESDSNIKILLGKPNLEQKLV